MAEKQAQPIAYCENCGTALKGDYCHSCGQKAIELRRPVIALAMDIIVDTFAIDSKLFRTIKCLFFNPGALAQDYIIGRRARYSPPFRIFLFFSLLFFATMFLIISLIPEPDEVELDVDVKVSVAGETVELDTLDPQDNAKKDDDSEEKDKEPKSWEEVNYNGPAFMEGFARRIYENIQTVEEDPRLFFANVRNNMPRVLFLMPAVYVLLLLLFYFYKKGVYVYDLLIISLYMHGALYFYLWISVVLELLPFNDVPIIGWMDDLLPLWGIYQSYRVLSINFTSRWYSVLIKGTLINFLFWMMTVLLIVVGMALSLFYQ